MKSLALAIFTVVTAAVAWFVAPLLAQPTALTPFATATTVLTSSIQIVAPNPSRKGMVICNSQGGQLNVAPQPTAATNGLVVATGSCFTPPANLLASGSLGVGGAGWNGITGGSSNVIVLEW